MFGAGFKKKFYSVFLLLFCLIGYYSAQEFEVDENETKSIEKKWSIDEAGKPSTKEKEVKQNFDVKVIAPPFFSMFEPEKQEFQINPFRENTITGKYGTKITFPAGAIVTPNKFKKGNILTVELVEVLNDMDFITTGIGLDYSSPKGTPHIFESGGMFRISASFLDKPLNIKKGMKLKVQFRVVRNQPGMNVYKLDEFRGWMEKGTVETDSSSNQESKSADASFSNGEGGLLYSVFSGIDGFGWWNFDKPNPDITCLQGSIDLKTDPHPPYFITVVGIDVKGAYSISSDKLSFKINSLQKKQVKLIVMDSRGNFGVSSVLETGDFFAHLNGSNNAKLKCKDAGTVELNKTSPDLRKDRSKLLNFLGLYDEVSPIN